MTAVAAVGMSLHHLPSGTVTFLFTDIEGSTRLLQRTRDRYAGLLHTHGELVRTACAAHGGHEMGTEGDALFFAFARARDAVLAAVGAQAALEAHEWAPGEDVRVRMGIHTGEPEMGEDGYLGLSLHRVARISDAGHGGQILLSRATADIVEDELPPTIILRDLGAHRLKDFDRPQRIFQVCADGLCAEFPPLRSVDAQPARSISGALEEQLVRARSEVPEPGRPLHRRPLVLAMFAGTLAAAVSIPVFAVARDELPANAPGEPPRDARLARTAKLSDPRVELVTFGEYRERLGAAASGIQGDVLTCPGVLLTYHVALEGFRNAEIPERWQLFDATRGTKLAESRAKLLRPTADRVEQDDQQFVPLPERAGRFKLVVQVLAADGRSPIADLSTGEFAARRTRPPTGIDRPPRECLDALAG